MFLVTPFYSFLTAILVPRTSHSGLANRLAYLHYGTARAFKGLVWIYFLQQKEPTPDSLLPARLKFPDWRGLGIPYKYQKGEPLPSSQTWVDHDGGKEYGKQLGLCYVLRVPGTQLTESQRKKIRSESSTKFYFKNFKGRLCDNPLCHPTIYASKDAVKMGVLICCPESLISKCKPCKNQRKRIPLHSII